MNKSLTIQSSFIYIIGVLCMFLYNLICFVMSKYNCCMFLNIKGLLYVLRSARNHNYKKVSCNTHFMSINFKQFHKSWRTKFESLIRYNPSFLCGQYLQYCKHFPFQWQTSIDGLKRAAKMHAELVVMRTVFVPCDFLPNVLQQIAFHECINESSI